MYRIYRKIPDPFQGDFEFCLKNKYILEEFDQFYGPFPGVSLMMREVSHVCYRKRQINLSVIMKSRMGTIESQLLSY